MFGRRNNFNSQFKCLKCSKKIGLRDMQKAGSALYFLSGPNGNYCRNCYSDIPREQSKPISDERRIPPPVTKVIQGNRKTPVIKARCNLCGSVIVQSDLRSNQSGETSPRMFEGEQLCAPCWDYVFDKPRQPRDLPTQRVETSFQNGLSHSTSAQSPRVIGYRDSNGQIIYEEYLWSEEWRTMRQVALARSGYCCSICKASRNDTQLDVHHNTYDRLGDEQPSDLIVLCRSCHDHYHDRLRPKQLGTNNKLQHLAESLPEDFFIEDLDDIPF